MMPILMYHACYILNSLLLGAANTILLLMLIPLILYYNTAAVDAVVSDSVYALCVWIAFKACRNYDPSLLECSGMHM